MSEEVRKNDVFNAPTAKEQLHTNEVSSNAIFEVPKIEVPLPSNGLVYPPESPLHGKQTILIESMTTKQENILTSRVSAKRGTTLTELVKSCLCDKTVDPRKMLTADRNTVMIALRASGYGPDYHVSVDCPKCGENSKQEFDLSSLPVRRLEIHPVESNSNIFSYTLPQTKAIVHFKFLLGEDEEEIVQTQAAKKKRGIVENDMVTSNLLHSIVSITTQKATYTDRAKIAAALPSLPAYDSRALRKYIQDNEPGMQMKGMMECPHCEHVQEVDMPLGANFFWPDSE